MRFPDWFSKPLTIWDGFVGSGLLGDCRVPNQFYNEGWFDRWVDPVRWVGQASWPSCLLALVF